MLRTSTEIKARFDALTELLKTHRLLWETRPFVEIRPDWENEYPDLARWLRERSHEEIDQIEEDSHVLEDLGAPPQFLEWHKKCSALTKLESFESSSSAVLQDPALGHAIPARKWAQIRTFVEACQHILPDNITRVIDWCAGKGHISRMLNLSSGLRTTALEKRKDLCMIGENLASERGLENCEFISIDVLSGDTDHYLAKANAGIALHACGHLTDELFTQALAHDFEQVISVPCCYHNLGGAEVYEPQSQHAVESGLRFSQANLRLATAHESVARKPIRQARRREMAYRLGLDLLFREATGIDRYHQQGPFPKAMLDLEFGAFCREASKKLGLPLPEHLDEESAEVAGQDRALEARALSLVRACFRRPMELWLVLDRALRLLEAGRKVEVGLFCPQHMTPRNIMIASARV